MIRSLATLIFVQAGRLVPTMLLLFVLSGCLPADRGDDTNLLPDLGRDAHNTARLNGFLTLKDNLGAAIRLEVDSIEVLADDLWIPLTNGPLKIDSASIGTGQLFLFGRAVPPGRFHRLRMAVTKGEVQKTDGKYVTIDQKPFTVEVELPADLNVETEASRSLSFTWDVQNSLLVDSTLRPALYVYSPLKQLQIDLVFVACPDIDTVFVVRADNNWVVDSFGLKGRPTYLAIDPDSSRQRLYVLACRDRVVKMVDLSSYRVVDLFRVPLNDAPTFMTISPDGLGAFLLDERSGYLSRMDLTTGRSVARVQLGHQPNYAVYLVEQNLLAVSLSLSQKVLLLDPLSLRERGSISTGSVPQGMVASGNQLYIAENGDNTVSIIDLASMGNQSRLTVGFGPRRLLATANQIYVSNYQDGTLSVLVPGQLGVMHEINGLGRPLEMVFDQFYRRLYVTDEESSALAVIDVNANRLFRQIYLGAKPVGLAAFQ